MFYGKNLKDFSFDEFLDKNKLAFTPRFDQGPDLHSGFQLIRIAPDLELPNLLQFKFQYKYIFKDGLLSLRDLFKDRETGTVYLGVSQKEDAKYDGQHGNAQHFLRHDIIHAYTAKYFDKLLFEEFKARNVDQMVHLKSYTNALLQARIKEYQAIKDPELRDAIEVQFFSYLHEQSRTYPIGVENDFKNPKAVEYYKRALPSALKENRFGEEFKYLLDKPGKLKKASAWIKARAIEDAKTLREQYR